MKRQLALVCSLAAIGGAALLPSAAGAKGSMMMQPNIVQVAASAPQFSTLVSLVKKAGLVKALEARGKLTVFAPTNAAFAALHRRDPKLFAMVAGSRKLLAEVLEYHVVRGDFTAARVIHRRSLRTLLGQSLGVIVKGGHVFIRAAGDRAEVIKANIMASNGVIHAINAVLLPKL
ncbi:MAG TPA: fasciclin domain-containing protein [Solirubrobacteraceae bacterium]|nr:fasciclin domain-containing protein [Solirubrobacteraceae bacterium]